MQARERRARSGDTVGTLAFETRRALYRESLVAFLAAQPDRCLLTQMPGNIGDHLIWAGTRDLLQSAGLTYATLDVSSVRDLAGDDARTMERATLLVPGSGALTRHRHEWLPRAVLRASRAFGKVVILPSTFDPAVPIVARCLSQPNVYPFAREVRSYRAIKALGRAALSIDCAVYFDGFATRDSRMQPGGDEGEFLLSLREDNDSRLGNHGLMPHPILNRDISLRCPDLGSFVRSIESARSVITDRLHVAVATVMLGRRLIYTDPDASKITNYFAFTFRGEFSDLISEVSIPWLVTNGFAVPKGHER